MEPCIVRIRRPYLLFDVRCSKCSSYNIHPTSTELVYTCNKCDHRNYSTANVNLYHSYVGEVLEGLYGRKEHNEIILIGERCDKDIRTADITPKTMLEDDILHCILHIKDTFSRAPLIVSELQNDKVKEDKTNCLDCGYCNDCVTCVCGKIYKGVSCPVCKSRKHKKTFVKNISKTGKCPHCNSINISLSTIESKHSVCPFCESKNIKKARVICCYKLSIKRNVRDEING